MVYMILRSWSFAPVLGVQHLFKLYLIIGFSSALRERRKAVYAVCAVCAVCAVLPLCLSSRSAAGYLFRIVESRRHNFRRTWSCMVSCAPNSSDNDLDPFSSSFWAFRLLRYGDEAGGERTTEQAPTTPLPTSGRVANTSSRGLDDQEGHSS